MGKVVEKKRKKKKGRPSLLDLQKRSIKQQQQQQKQLNKHQVQQLGKKSHKFQNPNPNLSSNSSLRRSTRRNPNPSDEEEDDDDDDERKEKKVKLVLKLPEDDDDGEGEEPNSGSDSGGSSGSNIKKRKIESIVPGSAVDNHDKGEKRSASANQASTQQGSQLDDGPSTPLPDKKLLLFILDRLQKKDTYGVFVEPVDPEELPDYHEVIEHPMDFSTVRKKLEDEAYSNLEQFEKDIFLICSNAMQYNAPDTIYFRQARSIQELAKKDFENLRQDSDDNEPKPEPKIVRRGRPPTKHLKRPPGRPPLERANSEATLATSGGNASRPSNDMKKGSPIVEKQGSADLFTRTHSGSRYGEALISWSERYERFEDMTGSVSKGISVKHGKKNIVLDETRRNTYTQACALACRQEQSVLTMFDGERKLLIPVGLHAEHGYARSLSRFAAKLGPVAWKVASRKIERCLPAGVKFGPGWVGENDCPAEKPAQQQLSAPAGASQPSPPASSSAPIQSIVESRSDSSAQKPQEEEQLSEMPTSSGQSKLDDESIKSPEPSATGNDPTTPVSPPSVIPNNGVGTKLKAPETNASSHSNTTFNILNSSSVANAMRIGRASQIHQNPLNQSRMNGLNGSYGLNFAAQMGKMIGAARSSGVNLQSNSSTMTVSKTETQSVGPPSSDNNSCEEAKLSENSGSTKPNNCLPNAGSHQKVGSGPSDLNVGFQSPGSPGSGKADSVQPDLALQL